MDNGIRDVILSFIGILPSHNLIELEYHYRREILNIVHKFFSFKIVNVGLFET